MTAGYTIEGLRAWKQNTATGALTYFLYDGPSPVVELDSSGAVIATNTYGICGLVSRNVAGVGSTFYTFDERGNTVQRLTSSGTVVSSDLYSAYGTRLSGGGDPFGFGAQFGYYTDAETGFVLCTLRYYDPGMGRWINRDPIDYSGGVNVYGYMTNNPINLSDPLGLYPPSVVSQTCDFDVDTDGSGPSHGDTTDQVRNDDNDGKYPTGHDEKGKITHGIVNSDTTPYLVRRGPDMHKIKKGDFGVVIYHGHMYPAAFMDSRDMSGGDFKEGSVYLHNELGNNPFPKPGSGSSFKHAITIIAFPNSGKGNLPPGFIYDPRHIADRVRAIVNNPNRMKGVPYGPAY